MPNKKKNASKWSSFQLKKSLLKVFFLEQNWSAFGLFFKKIGLPDKVGTLLKGLWALTLPTGYQAGMSMLRDSVFFYAFPDYD